MKERIRPEDRVHRENWMYGGVQLKALRGTVSLRQMSGECGVGFSHLSRVENGYMSASEKIIDTYIGRSSLSPFEREVKSYELRMVYGMSPFPVNPEQARRLALLIASSSQ